jgi:hypothetical protein
MIEKPGNDNLQVKIDQAVELIAQYGWIDGAHHKQWVLDQVLRALLGEGYEKFIADNFHERYREGDEDVVTDHWDRGIAP